MTYQSKISAYKRVVFIFPFAVQNVIQDFYDKKGYTYKKYKSKNMELKDLVGMSNKAIIQTIQGNIEKSRKIKLKNASFEFKIYLLEKEVIMDIIQIIQNKLSEASGVDQNTTKCIVFSGMNPSSLNVDEANFNVSRLLFPLAVFLNTIKQLVSFHKNVQNEIKNIFFDEFSSEKVFKNIALADIDDKYKMLFASPDQLFESNFLECLTAIENEIKLI